MSKVQKLVAGSQLLKGYKQTEVGTIPEDWQCIDLEQLNPFITSGSRGWADFYSEYGDPFVRITNMFRESISIDLQDLKYVKLPVGMNEGKRTQLYNDDLLISITADIGIISYVDRRLQKPAYINQHIALVRFDKEKVNSQFISYFLAHENSQKWFRGGTDQGAKAGMSLITVRKIKVAVPALREQEAIAHALSDIDALIESLDRLLTKKRQIKQGAMQELLRSKEGWVEKKLSEIAEIRSGGTPSTSRYEFWDGDILWCTPTDITALKGYKYLVNTSRLITLQGLNSSSAEMIPANSVIMTSRATIGECAINRVPVSTNQGFKNFIPSDRINVEFLYYLLQTQKQKFISLCGGSTFLEISKNQLSEFLIELPSLLKQIEIAAILSDMDAEIDSIEAKLTKTRQIKQGMMHELLTGRIRLI